VNEILYSNFVMDGKRPFAAVPKPHDRITLIELRNDTAIKPFTPRRVSNVDVLLEVSRVVFCRATVLLTRHIQEKFLRWTSRVASHATYIDQSTLLQLYGYYKQATEGDNLTSKRRQSA
jgi:hypothetical protein